MISNEEFERAFHATKDALTTPSTRISKLVKRGEFKRAEMEAALRRFSESRARSVLMEIDKRWQKNPAVEHEFQKRPFFEILREVLNFKHIYDRYDREVYKAFIGYCKIRHLRNAVAKQVVKEDTPLPLPPFPVSLNAKTNQLGWDF